MKLHASRGLIERCRDQRGYTLTELTVGIAVTLIVAVAVMTFILSSTNLWQTQEERVTATDEARNALQRMTNELRDASAVTVVDARTVDAQVRRASSGFDQIRYQCAPDGALSSCTRTNFTAGGSVLLSDRVVNEDNFAIVAGSDATRASSQGGSVQIALALELDRAENPVLLRSAVRPRNCSTPGTGVVNPPC